MSAFRVPYNMVGFFESILTKHKSVRNYEKQHHHYFIIDRGDLPAINCVLVDIYTIGVADIIQAQREFPEMNCMITGSNWNAYSPEAKFYGLDIGVGVFEVSEVAGALRASDFVKFHRKNKDGGPSYSFRSE